MMITKLTLEEKDDFLRRFGWEPTHRPEMETVYYNSETEEERYFYEDNIASITARLIKLSYDDGRRDALNAARKKLQEAFALKGI